MSGIKFLLDTNIILGLLKSSPEVLTILNQRRKGHRVASFATSEVA